MLNKILDFCFTTSKQPVLLKDLLVANVQHNEKMHVDAAKLGFRLKIGNAYIIYICIISIFAVPSQLFHIKSLPILTHMLLLLQQSFSPQ